MCVLNFEAKSRSDIKKEQDEDEGKCIICKFFFNVFFNVRSSTATRLFFFNSKTRIL